METNLNLPSHFVQIFSGQAIHDIVQLRFFQVDLVAEIQTLILRLWLCRVRRRCFRGDLLLDCITDLRRVEIGTSFTQV